MLHIDPGPERARLAFKDAVLSNFGFLSDLGFRLVEESATLVRFESSKAFVNVYHGRASFELGVEVGGLENPDQKVTLYEMVVHSGAEKLEGFGQHVMFQVSSREGVQEFVPKLARLVREYAMPFLRPDPGAYAKVLQQRLNARAEYEKHIALSNMRREAETAWQSKDYARLIELYDPVRRDLTEIEIRRLGYAEKQVVPAIGAPPLPSKRKRT